MKSLRLYLLSLLALVALSVEAHAVQLCNKVWVEIDSTGTADPITLGAAVSGNQTVANCGVTDGQTVRYSIFDGANWEVGSGVYTASGTTLTRVVLESSNSDTEIDLTASATLVIAPLTQDLPSETTATEASPTASDYIFILQSGVLERSQVSAFESALESFLDAADLQGDIALGTDTSGNYVDDVTAGTGIAVTHTPGEGSDAAVAFSYTDKGNDPALSADECYFTSNATTAGYLVCEGDTANTVETRIVVTDPTSSDKTFTIPDANSIALADGDKGDITVGSTGTDWQIDAGAVGTTEAAALDTGDITTGTFADARVDGSLEADEVNPTLGSQTQGNYVQDVADGTGIDGTAAAEGATYTPTLDTTEITTNTWGVNNFTTQVFSTDGVDLTWDYSTTDAVATLSGGGSSPSIALDDQGTLRLLEEDGGGSNYLEFQPPAAITSNATCTLENDANFIPDSCVGDGTDDDVPESGDFTNLTGGTGITNSAGTLSFDATEVTNPTFGSNNFTSAVFSTDGVDITLDFTTTDAAMIVSGGGTSPIIMMDDAGAIRFLEEDAGGSNYKAFVSPSTVTADTTCTFEDDANFIPDSCVGDGSDDDVPESGDFTNLTGGTGIDNNSGTLDLDLTEVTPSATFGGGSFTTLTFDAGATDPAFSFGSATTTLEAIFSVRQADASNAGGTIRLLEDPGTGTDYIALLAPASITTTTTCTLENDGNPIPDSCVGDGVDNTGGAGSFTDPATLESTDTGATAGPTINMYRNSATPAADDLIGIIDYQGEDDAGATQSYAQIAAKIQSPAAAGPDGLLIFRTANDDSLNEVLRMDDFNVAIFGGAGVNSTGALTAAARRPRLQAIDDSIDGGSALLGTYSTTDADVASLYMAKSGNATAGNHSTAVATDEPLGQISFQGSDGTDLAEGATIRAEVDASPGSNDMPTRLEFATSADASQTPTERLRINSTGSWGIAGANFGTAGQVLRSAGSGAAVAWGNGGLQSFCVKLGDTTTAITTGDAKNTIHMPYAFTVTAVSASLKTVSSSGTVNLAIREDTDAEGGTAAADILSTDIDIEANERRSSTATTQPVVSDASLAADSEILFDIDTAGTGAVSPLVCIEGYPQ